MSTRSGTNRKRGQKASIALSVKRMRAAYDKRDALVRRLGYVSYQGYLRSAMWAQIRRVVINGFTLCHFCSRLASQVHHGEYTLRNLSGKSLRGLYPVCDACHEAGEYTTNGRKLSPVDATRRMRMLARSL